jgi:transposase
MWTKEQRAIYWRDEDRYPSNLTDAEWKQLKPLIPEASPGGRPRKTDMRAAMNAIFYLLRTGCPWRYLPRDEFPPRSTVYNILRKFQKVWRVGGYLGRAAHGFARATRARGEPHGSRHRQPDAKGGGKGGGFDGEVGYDAGKKVKGRKIHALVDTEGLPLQAIVHSAGIQDRDGAALVLDKIRNRFPWLELVWADNGYNAWQVEAAVAKVPVLRL